MSSIIDADEFRGIDHVVRYVMESNKDESMNPSKIMMMIMMVIIIIIIVYLIMSKGTSDTKVVENVINDTTFKNYLEILIERRVNDKMRDREYSQRNSDSIYSDRSHNYSRINDTYSDRSDNYSRINDTPNIMNNIERHNVGNGNIYYDKY